MSDGTAKSDGPGQTQPPNQAPNNQTQSSQTQSTLARIEDGEQYRQKLRGALPRYVQSLVDKLAQSDNPPKTTNDDLLTVLSICKQVFGPDEMLTALSPELLPIIKEKLLPAVKPRERGPAITALAHLSDKPLWHQEMVRCGYADEVTERYQFTKYQDFIKAIHAIDQGQWTFYPYEFRELCGRNFSFTTNFECLEDELAFGRVCERVERFFDDWKKKIAGS